MFTYSNNKMKRVIPYLTFLCLTGLTTKNGLPVMAGGCNSHMNNKAEIKCAEDDIECQNEKAEKYGLIKTERT